ncbi:MAG TPA: hypothetical protein VE860_19895 [Chthoniobacterales bacterium]|jgi:hypothetical protein|nr:hypothetical protein [Chthoniobacterales bacterium]
MIFLLLILNFAISWFNAWSVGRVWVESKMIGGFSRMTVWCGAIMSACGFTWVYIALLGMLAQSFEWLPARYIQGIFSLGYLVIILPLLGSGLGIAVSSWVQFWRRKNLINGGIAAWNTYAQISNVVSAVRFVPEAIGNVFSAFKGDDDEEDNRALLIMLAVVLVAVGAGVMTARAIILGTARKTSQAVLTEIQTQQHAT